MSLASYLCYYPAIFIFMMSKNNQNINKKIYISKCLSFFVAGPGLEPGTSAYETDEMTIFYASRNFWLE